jgi:DNA repair photolyase
VVNTYVGCRNRCWYCYTTSYTRISDIFNPRCKKDFRRRLEQDVEEYCSRGFSKYPVYVSSNCEAFDPTLEERYGDALYTLRVLEKHNFPIIIMTKNPGTLLQPIYSDIMDKSRTVVQVTIPFLDSRFEPYAPPPQSRLKAVGELIDKGFTVVVRLDPLVPSSGMVKGQSREEIDQLIEQASNVGVRKLVSKCLRLTMGIKKLHRDFYDQLKPYYLVCGYRESPPVRVLKPDVKEKLLTSVYEACGRNGVAFFTCMDHVSFRDARLCDGTEEILGLRIDSEDLDVCADTTGRM